MLTRLVSPDGRWAAIVREDICSDGLFSTGIGDTVQLVSSEVPGQQADVLASNKGGNPAYRPVVAWMGPNTLRITVPNTSLIGLGRGGFEAIKIDLRFEPDDPDGRTAFLKRLGLPPDLQVIGTAPSLTVSIAGMCHALHRGRHKP